MKGGKDEEKNMGPLFPRLHVNDTERGGPRAPPRNKMALYEQLSIPSQRFNSRSTLPHNNGGSTVVPWTSSSQEAMKGAIFPRYATPSVPALSAERHHSRSSDGVNLNATAMDFERTSMATGKYQTPSTTRHSCGCNSLHPHEFSHSNNPCGKKVGNEDDFMFSTFIHSGNTPVSSKDQQKIDRERLAPFSLTHLGHSTATGNSPLNTCNSLIPPQSAHDKLLNRSTITDMKSRQHLRNQSEEESVASRDHAQKPASHQSPREKIALPLKYTHASSNQERRNSLVGNSGRSCNTDAQLHTKYRDGSLLGNTIHGDDVLVQAMEGIEKGNASKVGSNPCSRASLGGCHMSPNEDENSSEDHTSGSLQAGDADRNDDISETSMVDSISGLDISPDDVVGVIGQKHFWKARRAIINQQRVFAGQVFELHRLIKVQRLIAESPHLLEDNPFFGKPPLKVSPVKKLPSDQYVLKSPPQIVKLNDSQKPNRSTECTAENAVRKLSLPSLNNVGQNPSCGRPCSGNRPPAPVATDNKVGPWSFHPPQGNQWLVPVMSPSEGLVYMPYTGPCPPTGGFMAPVYGGCGPLSVPSVAGDFLNPIYGVPASHHQGIGVLPGPAPVGQPYFSPYGFPVMNPMMSSSAVKQMRLFAGAQPHRQSEQFSTGEVNFNMQSESLRNMSNQKSEAISTCVRKFRISKESELQGSTASSPCEESQGEWTGEVAEGRDALPLFPSDPATQISNQTSHSIDQLIRVIKVVPHNRRSATESAARIFRSIQEERQQHDSG